MDKSESSNEVVIGDNSLVSSSMEYPATLELNLEGFDTVLLPELSSHLMAVDDQATALEGRAIIQLMDIQEPLSKLKMLLEDRLGLDLTAYSFILQNSEILEPDTNLVDRCVQGEGIVQINLQILASKRLINIDDVLNPTEQYLDIEDVKPKAVTCDRKSLAEVKEGKIKHWQVDLDFKKEQERLKIPADPEQWEVVHVKHWLQWAVRQFNLPHLKLCDWEMTGRDLFKLTIKDFRKMVPNDPGDIFWTHIELLRQMRKIATMKHDVNSQPEAVVKQPKLMRRSKPTKVISLPSTMHMLDMSNRSSSGGQVQLWQFLIDLLTSRDYRNIIHWLGKDGEFKLSNPDAVAQLWGERKNKPTMNYEKLSRALRYYYEGDMISKVPGKRFVYRFVCDLKQVIGYSAIELANLVNYGNPNYRGCGKNGV